MSCYPATPNANSRTDTVQTVRNLHEAEHVLYLRARLRSRYDECERASIVASARGLACNARDYFMITTQVTCESRASHMRVSRESLASDTRVPFNLLLDSTVFGYMIFGDYCSCFSGVCAGLTSRPRSSSVVFLQLWRSVCTPNLNYVLVAVIICVSFSYACLTSSRATSNL